MDDSSFEGEYDYQPLTSEEEALNVANQDAQAAEFLREESAQMEWFVRQIWGRGEFYGISVSFKDGHYTLMMPNDPAQLAFPIIDLPHASDLLASEFEKYVILGSYRAIWSRTDETIEAAIYAVSGETGAAWERLCDSLETVAGGAGHQKHITRTANLGDNATGIRIGLPSDALDWFVGPTNSEEASVITLTISGLVASDHQRAVEALEQTANSLFFQLYGETGVALQLDRSGTRIRTGAAAPTRCPEFRFKQAQLDPDPLALYWYGIQMADRPFRFLRLFQCVEFYFTEPGLDAVKRAVADIVRDRTFDPASPEHIQKLITVASKQNHTEEEQLEAVLRRCLTAEEVRYFLMATQDRRIAFSPKDGTDKYPKLNPFDEKGDLLKSLAKRLYSIRCSIVHGRRNAKLKILMPDSDVASRMGPDIEVMEYVAQHVLAHTGGLSDGAT